MREDDPITAILAILGVFLVLGPSLLASRVTDWLVAHRVLVPPAADPVVVIPCTGSVGLDGRRLVALAAVLVVVIAAGVLARIRTRRQQERR